MSQERWPAFRNFDQRENDTAEKY
ncbi:hypothetical protein ALC57_08523 [Trachymyrmex cornetzi]|uniref:Uncharacterized protein n=1 Tax=Trachymyrmex cornetzi TaxID=471704 RepID=A0A195E2N0_9HYME|nr:hypothetical protein ALC57_08523 [Trachymyrmex cornetzi]